ncbi:hypothetical protein FRC12_004754 [Ceratobasidium sp. 428]|nr:hypothetical protein FRC12_004754 [Ceratobasidium sp. 428]
MSDRIIYEGDTTHLRIGAHLQNLIFDDRYDISHKRNLKFSEALACFQMAIPKLKCLSSVSWESDWLPDNPTNVFETFQLSCPELRSVSLYISSPWFNFRDNDYLKSLFCFKDKLNISVRSKRLDLTPDPYSPLPQAMIDMIRASPDLRSLELDLSDYMVDRLRWSPDQLCSSLDVTFPNLRVLRMLGATTPDWQSFFEDPEASSYHQFLQRHPKLHTVSIGWTHEHSWRDFPAESVAALFPSLRRFEGPFFICQALVSSSIAAQIESLSALDEVSEGDEMVDFSENAVDMPSLRSLSLRLEDEELDGDALTKVLSLAPSLTKLAVWSVTSEVVCTFPLSLLYRFYTARRVISSTYSNTLRTWKSSPCPSTRCSTLSKR